MLVGQLPAAGTAEPFAAQHNGWAAEPDFAPVVGSGSHFAVIDGKASPALRGSGNPLAIVIAFVQDAATADPEGSSSAACRVKIGLLCWRYLHFARVGTWSALDRPELAAAAVAPVVAAVAAFANEHSHKPRGSAASNQEFLGRQPDTVLERAAT